MRKDARDSVFKLLFSNLFNDDYDDVLKLEIFTADKLTKQDVEFAEQLLSLIKQNKSEILGEIENISNGYKIERIYPTDKVALMIAFCEMKYISSIPLIVSINESMELVRKYSTEESPNFVNGVLAEYKKRLEENLWFYLTEKNFQLNIENS